jgi:hypothetical protein
VSTRSLTPTPLGTVFSRAVELGKDRLFSFLKIPPSVTPIPEVVTWRHVTYDAMQIRTVSENLYRALKTPEFADRLIINATPMVRQNGEVTDLTAFHGTAVRDLLSRSYFRADQTWISPTLSLFMCKAYTITISSVIARPFQLNGSEQQALSILLAYYFLSQVTDPAQAGDMLRNSTRALRLYDTAQVNDIVSLIEREPDCKELTLARVCEISGKLGIARLKLDLRSLYTRLSTIGPDQHTSFIALEYPPYWAYLLLLAVSGRKTMLSFLLKNAGLENEVKRFAEDLAQAHNFLGPL